MAAQSLKNRFRHESPTAAEIVMLRGHLALALKKPRAEAKVDLARERVGAAAGARKPKRMGTPPLDKGALKPPFKPPRKPLQGVPAKAVPSGGGGGQRVKALKPPLNEIFKGHFLHNIKLYVKLPNS